MDFNSFFLPSLLLYGPFDTRTVQRSQARVYGNYFCAFVEFFCGLKVIVMILVPWERVEIALYLVELYIVNNSLQKFFYVCLVFLHFHAGFNYLYFGYLCGNPSQLRCLNMFFLPFLDELCGRYALERSSAKKFVSKSKIYRKIMLVIIWSFDILFHLLILRCLIVSYLTIPFGYFLVMACPLGLVTALSYHLLGTSFLRTYLLLLLTIEFLILRAENISRQIRKTFKARGKYEPKFSKWALLKRRKSSLKILQTINELVQQFKEANRLFGNLISPSSASCLLGGLIFPAFCFVNFPIYHKLIAMVLYALAIIHNCFVISIWNDAFISRVRFLSLVEASVVLLIIPLNFSHQIKIIESAVHYVMPAFESK